MKKFILLLTLFLFSVVTFGQTFEGTLTYAVDFQVSEKLSKMGVTKELMLDKMRKDGTAFDTVKTTYQAGNYYSISNNQSKTYSIYKVEMNKIYNFQDGALSDICSITDASIDFEYKMIGKMPEVQKLDTSVIINGYTCKVLRVKWKSGYHDYYYEQAKLKINPALYSKHVYDGWADYLKIAKALPVRIVKNLNGTVNITMTLVNAKPEKVNPKLFIIPDLVPDKDLNVVKVGAAEIMRIKK